MGSMVLRKSVKESIAKRAVEELFVPSLLEQWKRAEAEFSELMTSLYKDFDWEHVEPYRQFMNWHDEITLTHVPCEWNSVSWSEFQRTFNLPYIKRVQLSFKYPWNREYPYSLGQEFDAPVENILRPYVVQYLTAEKYYEEIKQVLLGINTRKQLEDTIPELVKFAPETVAGEVTALVPIEQINRVRSFLQSGGNING
jgi:hypothetical protein